MLFTIWLAYLIGVIVVTEFFDGFVFAVLWPASVPLFTVGVVWWKLREWSRSKENA